MPADEKQESRDVATDDSGTATRVAPKTRPARPKRKKLPPYKLILHNDDVNTMEDVVRAIVVITHLSTAVAVRKMLEAHHNQTSVLLLTHRERAELYVEQFTSMSITTTAEPDV